MARFGIYIVIYRKKKVKEKWKWSYRDEKIALRNGDIK